MGNHTSHGHGSPGTGKLVLPDGSIQDINESITVAELMLEHPKQVVVELKEAAAHKRERVIPLLADKKLEVNKFYVMVPLRRGKSAHLSPQEAHLILVRASMVLRSKTLISPSKFLPRFARIWPMCSGIEDYSHSRTAMPKKEVVALKEREMEEVQDDGVEDLELIERACYLKKRVCRKGWKPSLDTIEEKKCEGSEVSNWMSLATKVGKRIEHKGLVWG